MEQLNLITVEELKKGRVFYFENEDNIVEISYSFMQDAYCIWRNRTPITTNPNLYLLKRDLAFLIQEHDLKLTLKPSNINQQIKKK